MYYNRKASHFAVFRLQIWIPHSRCLILPAHSTHGQLHTIFVICFCSLTHEYGRICVYIRRCETIWQILVMHSWDHNIGWRNSFKPDNVLASFTILWVLCLLASFSLSRRLQFNFLKYMEYKGQHITLELKSIGSLYHGDKPYTSHILLLLLTYWLKTTGCLFLNYAWQEDACLYTQQILRS